ncbi:LOW QUALITY PROTEIN: ADTRP isoform 9, partial [Pan troglodytes]
AEVVLRPHSYPSKKTGLTLLAAASIAYISRILWLYFETGTWVYPVFAKLSPLGLAAFFSLSYVFIASIYLLGEKLNHWKWVSVQILQRWRLESVGICFQWPDWKSPAKHQLVKNIR